MAKSGSISKTQQGAKIILTWNTLSQSAWDNSSTIGWELIFESSLSGVLNERYCKIIFDGKAVFDGNNINLNVPLGKTSKTLASGTTTIAHAPNGSKTFDYSFTMEWDLLTDATPTVSASGSGTLDKMDLAVRLTGAPNFTDEENPNVEYIAFPCPAAYSAVDIGVYYSDEKTPEVAYKQIPDATTAQINLTAADKAALYAKMGKYTKIPVRYVIRTTYTDGSADYRTKAAYFSIVNYEPTLSPTVKDTNSRTVALTGNNQKFIKYFSNAQITVGATGRKGSSIEYRTIQNGSQFLDDYTSDTATLNAIDSNTFYLSATDTRGATTNGFKTVDLIPYVKFTCALETEPLTASGELKFTISGKYYKGSFGAKSNELEVEYMIKDSAGNAKAASESGWVVLGVVNPTVSGTDYSYSYTITGLNHDEQYELTVNAFDVLTPIQTVATIVQAVPVFDWGKSDFHHHTDIVISHNKVIRGTTPDGDVIEAINPCNQNGALAVGWGGYSNEFGRTDLMGNKVYVSAKDGLELNGGSGITISNQPLADFVVELGASGVWTYRKWNSGRVDVYGYENISNMPCTNTLGGWYRTDVIQAPAYPFAITSPNVVVSYESSGYGALVWQTTTNTSARPADYYLIRPTTTTIASGTVRWHISGKWK